MHSIAYFLDKAAPVSYNTPNLIGQFVTILSVNKTREFDGHFYAHFFAGNAR